MPKPGHMKLREDTPPAIRLKLENPQAYVLQEFEKQGLTLEAVAGTLLSVLGNELDGASRVAAARLFFDVTIGRSPATTNSRNLHLHAKTDSFFDEEKFSKTPAPKVE